MTILFLDKIYPELKENLIANGIHCKEDISSKKEIILKKIKQFDGIILRSRFKIDKQFIQKSSHLKFIARFGSGIENIDINEAKKYKIKCINAPKGNSNAVAEHTLGLLLSLTNNIQISNNEISQGIWKREENRGTELQNKTIGIIGYGNTGSSFAKKLIGFNCKILAYDKYKKNYGTKFIQEASLKNIFKFSDILSIHIPLNSETINIINDNFLKKFSKKIFFLNTSRGKIVNTCDLIKNLKTGEVIGAGLDVLEYENNSFEELTKNGKKELDFLIKSPKVILTSHIAGWSLESNKLMCQILTKKILSHLKSIS